MSGPPVLWIHGFPLSSDVFIPQRAISDARHFMPDLRGFGSAAPPSQPLSIDDYSNDMFSLLDSSRVRKAVVAGLSMGGYIALAMAKGNPERIAGLILIDTREVADNQAARAKRLEMIGAVEREGIDPVARDMLPRLLSRNASPELVSRVEAIIRRSSVTGVTAALAAMAGRPDSSQLLPRIEVPALVVVGSEDVITPVADSERMVARLPNARLHVVEGAGHLSNLEKPRDFNEAVGRFLAAEMQI